MGSARWHVPLAVLCRAGAGGRWLRWATERLPPQASRLDVCCCLRAQELPPPGQREGRLLRLFRTVYAPFLLHRVTRVVVVSGRAGQLGPHPGGAGAAQPDPHLVEVVVGRGELTQVRVQKPGWGWQRDSGSARMGQTQVGAREPVP